MMKKKKRKYKHSKSRSHGFVGLFLGWFVCYIICSVCILIQSHSNLFILETLADRISVFCLGRFLPSSEILIQHTSYKTKFTNRPTNNHYKQYNTILYYSFCQKGHEIHLNCHTIDEPSFVTEYSKVSTFFTYFCRLSTSYSVGLLIILHNVWCTW